ncbi:MAG: Diaminopimelate epimerase [Pseudomonadota bacterium]|jgi:diaminopimelate epimerase
MRIRFTKMQGAGNDFVVLDETRARFNFTAAQYRFLADRHFGVGADQILTVRPAPNNALDFEYVIHNADGGEVEHCGNGARCFVRYVRDKGLTTKDRVRVKVQQGEIELQMNPDGRVTVNMGAPILELPKVPFKSEGLKHELVNGCEVWQLPLSAAEASAVAHVAVVSMGNPHAVQVVDNVDTAPVLAHGPLIENHFSFPNRVNAGFMQIVSRDTVRLRVFERGAGETLACGTGACAAVVAGIRMGLLNPKVDVQTHGGMLTIEWHGLAKNDLSQAVFMTGPATSVFEGEIDVPNLP